MGIKEIRYNQARDEFHILFYCGHTRIIPGCQHYKNPSLINQAKKVGQPKCADCEVEFSELEHQMNLWHDTLMNAIRRRLA